MSIIFKGLQSLPFEATNSVRSLLDFLARYEFNNDWMAMQLKMGLLLANPYGRLAWYIAVSSMLYTWETVAKLRTASCK